jgi:hypothetical protein
VIAANPHPEEPPVPAHQRLVGTGLPNRATRWQQRVPGPKLPGLISGVTLLLGIWLAATPLLWAYGDTGGGFDARWNDALVGLALTALGVARLTRPVRLMSTTTVGGLLGGWLIIAPLLLGYGFGPDSTRATLNDMLVGVIVAGLSVIGYLSAREATPTGRR